MVAFGLSLSSLAALIFTMLRGGSIFLIESLAISFIFGMVIALSLGRKTGGAHLLTLTRKGIAMPVGFRSIMLEWDQIETITVKEHRGRNFLAIKMKSLESLPGIGQRIGALNMEDSGFHFMYREQIFELPLAEVLQILQSYLGDSSLRQSLLPPSEEGTPKGKKPDRQ
jgi:hypothetical protein